MNQITKHSFTYPLVHTVKTGKVSSKIPLTTMENGLGLLRKRTQLFKRRIQVRKPFVGAVSVLKN